jgi:Fic family protein
MENCSKSWKEIFVYESGLIDPQPGYPSFKTGQVMYDNHLNALNFVMSDISQLSESSPLDIHRLLTKNVEFFERQNNSGKYRTVDVWIGHDLCPNPMLLPNLTKQWFDVTTKLIEFNYLDKIPSLEVASVSHHMFECIHPFIDGNGRTGRLLFNMVLKVCGEDPRIIYFKDRFNYYDEIQLFRDQFFTGAQFLLDGIYEHYNLPPSE